MEWQQHPLAAKYLPQPTEEDLGRIKASLADHGFDKRYPIWLYEGKILVGWTRYRAATASKIEPVFSEYDEDEPIAFMLLSELPRRHLSMVQRLRIAETFRPELANEAKQRQRAGVSSKLHEGSTVNKKIASAASVSEKTAADYHAVQVGGSPALQAAVDAEEVSVSDAAAVARTATKPEQTAAVKKVRKKKAKTVVAAVASDADETVMLDAEDQNVPDHARDAFVAAGALTGICRELDDVIRRVKVIANGHGGRLIRFDSFSQQIKDAKGNLWTNRATHVCPYCKGKKKDKKCECCKDEGWTAKWQWEQAPGNNPRAKK